MGEPRLGRDLLDRHQVAGVEADRHDLGDEDVERRTCVERQALDRIVDVFPAERQDQIRVQLASSLSAVVAQRLIPRIGGGMVAAFEVLLATSAARNLVREGKTRQLRNVMTTSQADGMQTLEMSLSHLVLTGVISYEEAVHRALVPREVALPRPPAQPNVVPV